MRNIKIVVLISGTGRSLNNMVHKINAGELSAEIVHVIASTTRASGLQYAERARIPISIIEKKNSTTQEFSEAIFALCRETQCDYVVLAGFLKLLEIPEDFTNRVVNIHPSLTPSFSGKGYYGNHVHEAVLEYGAKITGCTVHFVDNDYDRGPVLLQRAIPVLETDTPETLNNRVFEAECGAYPEALQCLAEERVTVRGRIVRIRE